MIIGYNFGIDDGAKSKFGTHKKLIVLNISEYKYCVNKSSGISCDPLAKNPKLLSNREEKSYVTLPWWQNFCMTTIGSFSNDSLSIRPSYGAREEEIFPLFPRNAWYSGYSNDDVDDNENGKKAIGLD